MTASYQSLGIRPVINACATLTRLGGSLMPAEVVEAMKHAAGCYVDVHELQQKVGERIAQLTHNEAAYVSSGAAAGLLLATAACTVGADREQLESFPKLDGFKHEIIIQRMHRNSYDYAIREIGATMVEIGSQDRTQQEDLEVALSPKTAAIFWFQGAMNKAGELPLETVIEIAKARQVPVIVDAAAQLPPASNLWTFTQTGAALAIFSGGKDLSGPQSSGLIVGRRDLIEAIRIHGAPHHAVGRPMKVGKEEMMGLLAAVERYLKLDHEARGQGFEDTVAFWNDGLADLKHVSARRDYPNEAGQPAPRSLVSFASHISKDDIVEQLLAADPAIVVAPSDDTNGILLNPMTLQPGEAQLVLNGLKAVLGRLE